MSLKYLTVSQENHIVTCTMSNPPTHTMVAPEVEELHRFLDEIEGRKDVRVVVLTGANDDVFIKHYEVGELATSSEGQQGNGADAPTTDAPRHHAMNRLCLRLEALDAITIAAVNGNAAGGGCELSLACDFRLLKQGDYRYGLPETSVGIIPGAGGTQRFARLLGTAKALDLILHAHLMTPDEALDIGLAHRVFPATSYREDVATFAADLAGRSPIGLQMAKRSIQQGAALPMGDALFLEQEAFATCMRSKDAAIAMRASLEAAKTGVFEPKWEGI